MLGLLSGIVLGKIGQTSNRPNHVKPSEFLINLRIVQVDPISR